MTIKLLITSSCMIDNIWFTLHKGDDNKMRHKVSVMCNHTSLCEKHHTVKDSICSRCYSFKLSAYRKHSSMKHYMEHNSKVLREALTKKYSKLQTPDGTLRYNSTGDNETTTEVINIFAHARSNIHLHCAVWTKNYRLYNEVLTTLKPPKNLNLIWSMGKVDNYKFIIPRGFTKSFYVYTTSENLQKAMIESKRQGFSPVECQKACYQCQACYMNNKQQIVLKLIR